MQHDNTTVEIQHPPVLRQTVICVVIYVLRQNVRKFMFFELL